MCARSATFPRSLASLERDLKVCRACVEAGAAPQTVRVTNSGEFLHAAPWNVANIGKRSTSNGCTNLLPADAQRLFGYLQIGDPVTYTNVAGGVQPVRPVLPEPAPGYRPESLDVLFGKGRW